MPPYAVDVMLDDAKLFNSHYKPPPGRYVYPLNKECLQPGRRGKEGGLCHPDGFLNCVFGGGGGGSFVGVGRIVRDFCLGGGGLRAEHHRSKLN